MTSPAPTPWHLPGLADEVAAAVADLDTFETLLARHGVLAGFRHVRVLPILERIDHRVCGVALWWTAGMV
jgi:hypothetical protein